MFVQMLLILMSFDLCFNAERRKSGKHAKPNNAKYGPLQMSLQKTSRISEPGLTMYRIPVKNDFTGRESVDCPKSFRASELEAPRAVS